MRSRSLLVLIAVVASHRVARADEAADLEANSEIVERVQTSLKGLGFRDPYIIGGAALSLAMTARYGGAPSWHDIDIRAFARGPRDEPVASRLDRVAEALTRGGFAELLPEWPMVEMTSHHRRNPEVVHTLGFALRLKTRAGLRFDVPLAQSKSDMHRSGYNNAESLFIPLRGTSDLAAIMKRLATGSAEAVVARGDLLEMHGRALDVLNGKVVLTNRHLLAVEPELAALRYLRAVEKMGRFEPTVDAADLPWLEANLPRLLSRAPAVKDATYLPRVQEQAAALLSSGGPTLLATARRMGLDVHGLAAGRIVRALGSPASSPRQR